MNGQRVLVTGAGGFVGRAFCAEWLARGGQIRGAVRRPAPALADQVVIDVGPDSDWSPALAGCDAVVHLAARAHITRDTARDALAEFRRVNTAGTINLARQAARAGVRRFVFASSIGVNGAETITRPFTADDAPAPQSPYAISKLEAEQGLREIAGRTGLETVILRPPLVYGPDAPGNFALLLRWVRRGMPLPLGAIRNRRSLIGIDNLVSLLILCVTHSEASGQTFLVSDGEDLSTTELLRRLGAAAGRRASLLPVPEALLRGVANALGAGDLAKRLCGSLQVDSSAVRSRLGWSPPVTVDEGLRRAARGVECV
jgi:nucleoside-diphosphate-sugar epimerase